MKAGYSQNTKLVNFKIRSVSLLVSPYTWVYWSLTHRNIWNYNEDSWEQRLLTAKLPAYNFPSHQTLSQSKFRFLILSASEQAARKLYHIRISHPPGAPCKSLHAQQYFNIWLNQHKSAQAWTYWLWDYFSFSTCQRKQQQAEPTPAEFPPPERDLCWSESRLKADLFKST